MNLLDINKAVKTKRLSLTIGEAIMHYNLFVISIVVSIYFTVNGYSDNASNVTYQIIFIVLFLGVISFYIKWKQLKFKVYKIELTKKQIYLGLDKVCETNKWNYREQRFKTIKVDPNDFEGCVISTHSGFSSSSNKIRIILKNDEIYINSIPDGPGLLFVGKWKPIKVFNEIVSSASNT